MVLSIRERASGTAWEVSGKNGQYSIKINNLAKKIFVDGPAPRRRRIG
jgi:hypothetical protein